MRTWLKELRLENEKTQCDIAKYLDVSQSSYCKIEMGERQADLNLSIAIKLANFLGITIEEIVRHETKNQTKETKKSNKC